MELSNLDLEQLSRALDDPDPDREHYLNLETGSLWTFVFSESTDETRKERDGVLEHIGSKYLQVPSMTTQEAYEQIEDFVDSVQNLEVQDKLFRALERRGAFKNFREAILKYPEERLQWSNHRRERSRRRLESFLGSIGLEIPPAELGSSR